MLPSSCPGSIPSLADLGGGRLPAESWTTAEVHCIHTAHNAAVSRWRHRRCSVLNHARRHAWPGRSTTCAPLALHPYCIDFGVGDSSQQTCRASTSAKASLGAGTSVGVAPPTFCVDLHPWPPTAPATPWPTICRLLSQQRFPFCFKILGDELRRGSKK